MIEDTKLPHCDFTEGELEEMGEILLRADKIRSNDKLLRVVQEHLDKKSQRIKKIADLRSKMSGEEKKDS